jgi:hypothetical protein
MLRTGLYRPTTWDEVEKLVLELLEREGLGGISPQAYARRLVEAKLADAHERRCRATLHSHLSRRSDRL